ncbi:hypothetical protein LUL01_002350 [Staphylococcus pseudintermedius]|nr:hypothetical protein [Staphylococcus pseudintermedius]
MIKLREDLFNRSRIKNYENTMIDVKERYSNLPSYSLRVKGITHTKVHAVKQIGLYDNIDDVITDALEVLIQSYNEEDAKKISDYEIEFNEIKLKKANLKK